VRKSMLRLGLRGRHPHPPAPSPASGRGGEARALDAIPWGRSALVGELWCSVSVENRGVWFNCFAPLAPGRGERPSEGKAR